MTVQFTAHNIRLDDGSRTKPEAEYLMEQHRWFLSAKRLLETIFPGNKKHLRLVDLGCLEGGYSVEFARMGFQVLGIDVRQENIDACNYVAARTNLPNLRFLKGNALDASVHGTFDATFCCGLLYHLDRPREFLKMLGAITTKVLILQTHFSPDTSPSNEHLPRFVRNVLQRLQPIGSDKFNLSPLTENEGLSGRWYLEFADEASFRKRETMKWASWDNRKSFWLQRPSLIQAISEAGFDVVLEQFDSLGPDIHSSMERGYYKSDLRGTFVGIKTAGP